MLGDIIEEGIKTVLAEIGKLLFSIFIETVCFFTGEFVLTIVTLGWKRPRWEGYSSEGASRFWILMDLSTIVGLISWLGLLGFIGRKFGL